MRKTFLQTVIVLIIVLVALLAGSMIHIFLLFFAGIMLAVFLDFFGRQLTRLPWVPHWVAIAIVLIILTTLFGLSIAVVPPW